MMTIAMTIIIGIAIVNLFFLLTSAYTSYFFLPHRLLLLLIFHLPLLPLHLLILLLIGLHFLVLLNHLILLFAHRLHCTQMHL